MAERFLGKKEVEGPIPSLGSNFRLVGAARSAAHGSRASPRAARWESVRFETLYVKTQFNIGLEIIGLVTFHPR